MMMLQQQPKSLSKRVKKSMWPSVYTLCNLESRGYQECDICALSAKIDLSLSTTESGKVDWRAKKGESLIHENLFAKWKTMHSVITQRLSVMKKHLGRKTINNPELWRGSSGWIWKGFHCVSRGGKRKMVAHIFANICPFLTRFSSLHFREALLICLKTFCQECTEKMTDETFLDFWQV